MSIRLYNTLTRSKEELRPREPGKVGMYICGPTVYDDAHIGHARAYVAFDVLFRFLRSAGLEVTYVRNYTDVDDKIIRRAGELGEAPETVSERHIARYREDMAALGVLEPTVSPKVTEHIPEIVALVRALVERGHAYEAADGIYFEVRTFDRYGGLSGRRIDDLRAGARVEVDDQKRDPMDFALWKRAKPGEPSWDSPWGPGRPGWHIECSAMSLKYLGETFDIHGGGMDLVFPHHENEVAQSVCATGGGFARLWVHNGFVNVNKEKMSKSLGNFFTIRLALEHVHPEALRHFLLGTHYRGPIQFDVDLDAEGRLRGFPGLVEAERRVAYGYETLRRLDRAEVQAAGKSPRGPGDLPAALAETVRGFETAFRAALEDDLNHAEALGHLAGLLRSANEFLDKPKEHAPPARLAAARRLRATLRAASDVLGILHRDPEQALAALNAGGLRRIGVTEAEVREAIDRRTAARTARDFAAADRIRGELLARGVELMDTPAGTEWRVVGG